MDRDNKRTRIEFEAEQVLGRWGVGIKRADGDVVIERDPREA